MRCQVLRPSGQAMPMTAPSMVAVEYACLAFVNFTLSKAYWESLVLSSVLLDDWPITLIFASSLLFFLNLFLAFLRGLSHGGGLPTLEKSAFANSYSTPQPRGMAISDLFGISSPACTLQTSHSSHPKKTDRDPISQLQLSDFQYSLPGSLSRTSYLISRSLATRTLVPVG